MITKTIAVEINIETQIDCYSTPKNKISYYYQNEDVK